MPTRERPADRGRRRARDATRRLAIDLRTARIAAGLSQRDVGLSIGVSHSAVGRFERGIVVDPTLEFLGSLAGVVGLELSIKAYPIGDPMRDRAQRALLQRLQEHVYPSLAWREEVPFPLPQDLRAWDVVITGMAPRPWRLRIEAETNVSDVQALERRLRLKARDDPDGLLLLLFSDTRTNRAATEPLRAGLRDLLPIASREILRALREGREPPGSGIVVL